ncbi:MAG: TIGR03118 family protein [Verrucomicrobia bacterium]|nr:TIGR03118 family protein [Verrucomicrobiota bacterium]
MKSIFSQRLITSFLMALCSLISTGAAHGATTNVVYRNFSFTPKSVTINVGDTVVWTNAGGSHTVTGNGTDPFCGSIVIPVNCSHTFTNAGTFPYHCIPHQSFGMVGTVVVLAAPAANVPPTIAISSPTNNAVLSAPANVPIVTVPADSDGRIVRVDLYSATNLLGTVTNAPFSFTWTNIAAGSYTLTAKATDDGGAETTSAAVAIVVNDAPVVTLTRPADGAVFVPPANILLAANVANVIGNLTSVEFYAGTNSLGTVTNAPFSLTWSNAPLGRHVITAEAVDDLGVEGTSAAVSIDVAPVAVYAQHNLVSDIKGLADQTDPNLLNPWGIATSAASPFWIADNHAGLSTLYDTAGVLQSLIVTIPPPAGGTSPGAPTGVVFNNTPDFVVVSSAPTRFIFATEDGTIAAWNNSNTNAVIKVDNSAAGAIYKGLAIGQNNGKSFLYAADFHNGKIDAFDGAFQPATLAGTFADPAIPAGYAPFNVQNLNGSLFVTYARQDADKHDDISGPGNGFVNVFDTGGQLLRRFASSGALNSPWGLALVPDGFGQFSGDLLIGNFGDGVINVYDPTTAGWRGQLSDANARPIANPGLWALQFGNGGRGGNPAKLYFTAGIAGSDHLEDHGLFGSISPVAAILIGKSSLEGATLRLTWSGGTPPYVIQRKATLSDANWTDLLTTSETSAAVPKDAASGFYRIRN